MPEILGLDTGADDAARIMHRFIRKDWIDMEPSLYRAKWFDYRFWNPVQATYLYAHEFVRFYRLTYSKNYSSAKGDFVSPLLGDDLFEMPEQKQTESTEAYEKKCKRKRLQISGIWRGRQFADALGMPYAEYLEFAFHWTMRYWKQSSPPRPTQMYTDLVLDRANESWHERAGAMLFFSKLPQYSNDSYAKMRLALAGMVDPAPTQQDAHHEWLFGQLERRAGDPELFAKLIWQFNVLPEEKVRSRVGDETFGNIARYKQLLPNEISYH